MGKYRYLILIGSAVAILDQATKLIIVHQLAHYETIKIIPGFFNLTHLYNPGGAFGFAANQSPLVRTILFMVFTTLALGVIIYFYRSLPENYPGLSTALSLIFGGAVGNLIDRIRIGSVIDFLDVYIKGHHWPAFNVADSAVSIGMAIFIYHLLFNKFPE